MKQGSWGLLKLSPTNGAPCMQAIARIYRMGQKRQTFVYRPMYSGTMEEMVYRLNVHKKLLANRVGSTHAPARAGRT